MAERLDLDVLEALLAEAPGEVRLDFNPTTDCPELVHETHGYMETIDEGSHYEVYEAMVSARNAAPELIRRLREAKGLLKTSGCTCCTECIRVRACRGLSTKDGG